MGKILPLLGLVGALTATSAQAVIVTFDDVVVSGNPIYGSVASGDFTFSGSHFHIISDISVGLVSNGTQYLGAEGTQDLGAPVSFELTSGGVFSLLSADIAEVWVPNNPNNDFFEIIFTGSVQGGGVLNQAFVLDAIRDGAGGVNDFQNVLFAGWDNLTSVSVTGRDAAGGFGDYAIDNLNISIGSAVPEPGTWAMMLMGFGAVGFSMRRARRAHAVPKFA